MGLSSAWIAVVLAGGRSERFGADKAGATLAGRALLQHVVDGFARECADVVVAGPEASLTGASVTFVAEDPPGGGPCAGLVAGAAEAGRRGYEIVAVLATDMPEAAQVAAAAARMLESLPDVEAVLPLDAAGRAQPLAAAYRVDAIERFGLAADGGNGASISSLVRSLVVEEWTPEDARGIYDIDTPAQMRAAAGKYPRVPPAADDQ